MLVKTMHCKLCHKYGNEISRSLQLNYTWLRNSCVNFKVSANVENKAWSLHKAACHKILTKKGLGPREAPERVSGWQEPGQIQLILKVTKWNLKQHTSLQRKNCQSKSEKTLMLLEVKHGVQFG